MDLTEEETKFFKRSEYATTPQAYIEKGILKLYVITDLNNDELRVTIGYIKRILLEVAKKRSLKIDDDITFDIDKILKEKIVIPNDLTDFDVLYYKNFDELQKYVKEKTKTMNSDDIKSFGRHFCDRGSMHDGIREFMTSYIKRFDVTINRLDYEASIDKNDNFSSESEFWKKSFGDSVNDNEENDASIEHSRTDLDDVFEVYDMDIDYSDFEDIDYADFEDIDYSDFEDIDYDEFETSNEKVPDEEVSDEELINMIKFCNSYIQIFECYKNGINIDRELSEQIDKKKLEEFYSDKSFIKELEKIMSHDKTKHRYLFHGTTNLKDAENIINEGLGMKSERLDSTTYEEFEIDELLLYSRGLDGSIGRDAIVIVDQPLEEDGQRKNIVKPLVDGNQIHFGQSGLSGLQGNANYIVENRYIVGYVNKKNKEIIYNPKYYDYSRFKLGKSGIADSTDGGITNGEVINATNALNEAIHNQENELNQEENTNEQEDRD